MLAGVWRARCTGRARTAGARLWCVASATDMPKKSAQPLVAPTPAGIFGALADKSRRMVTEQMEEVKQVGNTLKQGAQTVREGAVRLSTEGALEDALRKGKERLSTGVAEAADVLQSSVPPISAAGVLEAASAVGSSLKEAVGESQPIDDTLRSKNRRILELEEEKNRLQAQLLQVTSDTAVKDAMALAQKKEQEVEQIKQRTVTKFKELAAEKQAVEEEKRRLVRRLEERERELASVRRDSVEPSTPGSDGGGSSVFASPEQPGTPETSGGSPVGSVSGSSQLGLCPQDFNP